MPEVPLARGDVALRSQGAIVSFARVVRTRAFWEQRSLHRTARLFLLLAVAVLAVVATGFIVASGSLTRSDLVAVLSYVALAMFAWRTLTAAIVTMIVGSVGVVVAGSGGDLLELAIAFGLVASTGAPWVIGLYVAVLVSLTGFMSMTGSTLAEGGAYGIAGIAALAFLVGVGFRVVSVREAILLAERSQAIGALESIAREDRERIADELHDGIAHDLTLVLFHARALPLQPDEAAREVSLRAIQDSAEQAQQSIQSLLSLMREATTAAPVSSSVRDARDVVGTVCRLADLLRDAGIPTRISLPTESLELSADAETALSEAAIETVTNVIKHAPQSHSVSIEIRRRSSGIELAVRNAARVGLDRATPEIGGRGLKRAHQRLMRHNGELHARGTDDGWESVARVRTGPA